MYIVHDEQDERKKKNYIMLQATFASISIINLHFISILLL